MKRWAGIQTVFLSCCEPDICSSRKRCIRGRDRGRGSCITVWIADIDIRRSIVKRGEQEEEEKEEEDEEEKEMEMEVEMEKEKRKRN